MTVGVVEDNNLPGVVGDLLKNTSLGEQRQEAEMKQHTLGRVILLLLPSCVVIFGGHSRLQRWRDVSVSKVIKTPD